ncbi:hypothetical protein V6N12_049836 [Hibiscus sabdariffa]|uniref:RNase H type-1 domain-containing protein n=1 Tax=Hibiscus sabdariffa TaxID=183260 RepID=A0ABR2GBS4_9ROSI
MLLPSLTRSIVVNRSIIAKSPYEAGHLFESLPLLPKKLSQIHQLCARAGPLHLVTRSRVVARNAEGLIMAAGIIPHHFVVNRELAEAYACVDALNLARDTGFLSIIIEGDTLTVINKVNCSGIDRSSLRARTKQVHDMRAFFSSLPFSYVGRSCNVVAHLLAREGRGFYGPRFWIEEAPPIVEQAALQDIWWVNSPI